MSRIEFLHSTEVGIQTVVDDKNARGVKTVLIQGVRKANGACSLAVKGFHLRSSSPHPVALDQFGRIGQGVNQRPGIE